jgi:hypothetical protein
MRPRLTSTQRAALAEWSKRTQPGRSYSIGEVFPDRETDGIHIRAMHRLVALGCLKPGIPGGNPLKEAD